MLSYVKEINVLSAPLTKICFGGKKKLIIFAKLNSQNLSQGNECKKKPGCSLQAKTVPICSVMTPAAKQVVLQPKTNLRKSRHLGVSA